MKKKILLSAFNVHTGGGYVLLSALFKIRKIKKFVLDHRIKNKIRLKKNKANFIKKKISSRIFLFHKNILFDENYSHLICFNNLPPLIKPKAKVILFIQTFYFFSKINDYNFDLYTTLRIYFEKIWFRLGIRNVDEIWIQTPTMKKRLLKFLGSINFKKKIQIKEVPICDNKLLKILNKKKKLEKLKKKISFFYPADASGHKNHYRLFLAFSKVKKPFTLYLTLDEKKFNKLISQTEIQNKHNFINLGNLKRNKVLEIYQNRINALIFPSLDESFGIPLIEACVYNKDILVSNRNYAHDLIENALYFNPKSIVSITRVLNNYLDSKKNKKPNLKKGLKFLSPNQFIDNIN